MNGQPFVTESQWSQSVNKFKKEFSKRFPDPKSPYGLIMLFLSFAASCFNAVIAVDPITQVFCIWTASCCIALFYAFANGLSLTRMVQIGLILAWCHLSVTTWLDGGIFSLKNQNLN